MRSQEFPRVPSPPERMASAICLFVAICLTFVSGSQFSEINNQKATTERRQLLEQNVTQDCDISLDPEINQYCCEIANNGTTIATPHPQTTSGYFYHNVRCGWLNFYMCNEKWHCVFDPFRVFAIVLGAIAITFIVTCCCYENRNWIKMKLTNLSLMSDRRTEANSMEMK